MARIDALYIQDPTIGSWRLVQYLATDGSPISHDSIRNLMRGLGLRAINQKPLPRCRANHPSAFPVWLMSKPSQLQIRSGPQIIPSSHCGKASFT
nr:transposase [Synechococcus sp. CCY 0621]